MKTVSVLALALASACVVSAQSENMHSKIEDLLKDDAKAYTKTEGAKKPEVKPTKVTAPSTAKDKAGDEKALAMPKYTVQVHPFAKESEATYDAKTKDKSYSKQIAWAEAAAKQTSEDKLLNNKKTSIMGPLSAPARSADAQARAHELEVKKEVVGTIVDPKDDKENKELLDELNDLEYQKKYR